MAGPNRSHGGLLTEINVTPLVDVVLVVLVLMMVTATSLASRTIPIELPKAAGVDSRSANRPMVVPIDENGALFLDKEPASEAVVRAEARRRSERGSDQPAILAADGRVRHEKVVHMLELLRSERVTKVAIVVRGDREPR